MVVLGKNSKLMGQPIKDGSMFLAILMSINMLNFGMLNMPKIKILLVTEIFFLPISVESHWLLFFVAISTSFDASYTAPSCARASSSMPIPLQTRRHNNERWGLVHRGRGGTSRGGEDSWVSEKYTSRLSRH